MNKKNSLLVGFTSLVMIALVIFLEKGQSYILIAYGSNHLKIHLSMVLFLALLTAVALYTCLYCWRAGVRFIKCLFRWPKQHRLEKNQQYLQEGLGALAAGDWSLAEKRLVFLGGQNATSPQVYLYYLGAALAAQAQGNILQCSKYIKKASAYAKDKQAKRAVSIRQSYVLVKQQNYSMALSILKPLHANEPKNLMLLKLLYQSYWGLQDWGALKQLLPSLRKQHVLSQNTLSELENRLKS